MSIKILVLMLFVLGFSPLSTHVLSRTLGVSYRPPEFHPKQKADCHLDICFYVLSLSVSITSDTALPLSYIGDTVHTSVSSIKRHLNDKFTSDSRWWGNWRVATRHSNHTHVGDIPHQRPSFNFKVHYFTSSTSLI